MKNIEIEQLALPEIKVIKYGRYMDNRGFFNEIHKTSDFEKIDFLNGIKFVQTNESFSFPAVIRGFHFQWNPIIGKFIRVVSGHIMDFAIDIRKQSKRYGKIVGYELRGDHRMDYNNWIWIPPGFAHGFITIEPSYVQYLCTGEYNSSCEASISPFANDIDWSLCDIKIKNDFNIMKTSTRLKITDKDKNGYSINGWYSSEFSNNIKYEGD